MLQEKADKRLSRRQSLCIERGGQRTCIVQWQSARIVKTRSNWEVEDGV